MKSCSVFRLAFVFLLSFVIIGGCSSNNNNNNKFVITSDFPSDIKGGANNATLEEAALFAWQEFIALSWTAAQGVRDTPDNNELFGDIKPDRPLVWETYRHKVEIYPGIGDNPPGFVNDAGQSYGYDSLPPEYIYGDGEVEPCTGQEPIENPSLVNLDEVTQIGLAYMFAGASPAQSNVNKDPQLIRFLAKANRTHYEYVVEPVNSFWKHSPAYEQAVGNFLAILEVAASEDATKDDFKVTGPVISFPEGIVEIKTAFRNLTNEELNSGRFYTTRVRYYEQDDEDPDNACYREAVWGLIGIHIIHKTPTAPSYIYATFEQADNLLDPTGNPVEDVNGDIINPFTNVSTTPALSYMDGDPPVLNIVGTDYCDDTGQRLFYNEVGPLVRGFPSGLPFDGFICQNTRDRRIPQTVVDVNKKVHDVMQEYNIEHGLEDTPWMYYKLVNVQAEPFDISAIDSNNYDSERGEATFYLNNIVIETDYTLQNLNGGIYTNSDIPASGPPTNFPPNFQTFNPLRLTKQNVLTFDDDGNLTNTYNMGGCMGCHGGAQFSGTDFSFILSQGRVIEGPEAPGVTTPGATNSGSP